MQVDKNKPYFGIDYPSGIRITHYPSGDTCLRHRWMIGQGDKWIEKLNTFLNKHDEVKIMANCRGAYIGHVDDFPIRGGGFKVGESVILHHAEYGEYAEKIVAAVPQNVDPRLNLGCFHENYVLESGAKLFWSSGGDSWDTTAEHHSFQSRIRKQRDGDPTINLDELMSQNNSFRI